MTMGIASGIAATTLGMILILFGLGEIATALKGIRDLMEEALSEFRSSK